MASINQIPKHKYLHHDFETASEADIKKHGVSRYARDPTTRVLMCAFALDDGDVKQWIPARGEPIPAELEDSLLDAAVKKTAFNSPFERAIWRHVVGIDTPLDQWRDTMITALYCGLPASLEAVCRALDVAEKYDKKDGKDFIKTFCVPQPATANRPARIIQWDEEPKKFMHGLKYNRSDVEAQRNVHNILRRYDQSEAEWRLWEIDQHINERGIPVNIDMAKNACKIRTEAIAALAAELHRLTGIKKVSDVPGLLEWLCERGYEYPNLNAGNVARAIAARPLISCPVRQVLMIRAQAIKTSTTKYKGLIDRTDADGHYRHAFCFRRSLTGRWSSRGVNVQNLPVPVAGLAGVKWGDTAGGNKEAVGGLQRCAAQAVQSLNFNKIDFLYDRPMDVLSSAVRGTIQAPEGFVFIAADIKYVENMILGWLTQDEAILEPIYAGRDPYLSFATNLRGGTYEDLLAEYKAGNSDKRKFAKIVDLGCGFKMGPGAQWQDESGEVLSTGLLDVAYNAGVKMTREEARQAVNAWRESRPGAVGFWKIIEWAAKNAIIKNRPHRCLDLSFEKRGMSLAMDLPSGRTVNYHAPRIGSFDITKSKRGNDLSYEHDDDGMWRRDSTHGGKLTQNAVQAIGADLLGNGILLAHNKGLDVFLHSHDELYALSPIASADANLAKLVDCITTAPPWWGDLPIRAKGFITDRFIKD